MASLRSAGMAWMSSLMMASCTLLLRSAVVMSRNPSVCKVSLKSWRLWIPGSVHALQNRSQQVDRKVLSGRLVLKQSMMMSLPCGVSIRFISLSSSCMCGA